MSTQSIPPLVSEALADYPVVAQQAQQPTLSSPQNIFALTSEKADNLLRHLGKIVLCRNAEKWRDCRMRRRHTGLHAGIDVLGILFFAASIIWGGFILFRPGASNPPEKFPSAGILKPDTGPDWDRLYRIARTARPIEPDPAWRVAKLRNTWHWIVIHHSATRGGSARSIGRNHRLVRHMKNGLAYHFVIGNGHGSPDGKVEIGGRWRRQLQGGHLREKTHRGWQLNRESIGICLIGNFMNRGPTAKQVASLKGLLNYLMAITKIDGKHIRRHRKMPDQITECPGLYLPLEEIIKYRKNPPKHSLKSQVARGRSRLR